MGAVYVPQATDWIGALEAGQKARMVDDKQKLGRQVGGLMASGNYKGAAAAAYGAGELDTGMGLTKVGAAQAEQTRRQGYGAKLAAGQGADAVKDAYSGGDFEIGKDLQAAIDSASEQQQKDAHLKATRVAEIVAPIGDLPLEQRKPFIEQHRTDLKAAGYTDQQIDTFEPTDANLATIYTQALGLKEYLERNAPKVVGDSLVRPSGEVVYQGTKFIPVPEGGKLVPVTGGRAGAPAPIEGAPAPQQPAGDWLAGVSEAAPDARVTSGLRTPEHNAAVGGVPTSRHLDGKAVDLVPRPGETMAELYARVRQVPGVKVINEGDHVHVQATGSIAPAGQNGDPAGTIYGAPKAKDEWVTLSPSEAAALGPGQYQRNAKTGEVKQVSGTAPKGAGAFKLAPQDSKYISEARTTSQQLANVVPSVKRFMDLNRQVGTGAGFAIPGVSMVGRVDPRIAEMQSITDKLTPAMRQGMPGAASDRDVAMFQSATVGLNKPGDANQSVANAIVAASKRQQDYVAFLENYAKTNGSLLGAQEDWDAYAAANPMFAEGGKGVLQVNKTTPWREFFGEAKAAPAGAPARRPAAAPSAAPAQPKAPHAMSDAEIKASLGLK